MRISELVKKTKVPKETIHYYIREGALPKPKKRGKNTADYDEEVVEQLELIRALQEHYFLPLSEIKKIVKQQKKFSPIDKVKFRFMTKNLRPIDQISFDSVYGREKFKKTTGMAEKWLTRMEEWGIITPEKTDDDIIYSSDNVIIGKLIVDMDRLGFGPRDGYHPKDLKLYADFVGNAVLPKQMNFLKDHLYLLSSPEFQEKGIKMIEAVGLFFYHLYRKAVKEEVVRILSSIDQQGNSTSPAKSEGG